MDLKVKLSNIQRELKAPKNLYNKFGKYNYRNAEGILEAFKPYQEKYKVSVVLNDEVQLIGDRFYIKSTATMMDVESEESIETSAFAREEENKKGMDGAQVTGSASSYARKYALNGLLLLDDTKDADTDAYTAKTKDVERISSGQAATLKKCIDKHRDPDKCSLDKAIGLTCKQYQVNNLLELDVKQFVTIMQKMGES